ncbi:hypothetical protein GcM3_129025, partial [Golovinomyces cichoracearum]
SHGVFVNHLKRIDYALHDTLLETEQHEWTTEELVKVRGDGNFTSAVYKSLSSSPTKKYRSTSPHLEFSQQPKNQQYVTKEEYSSKYEDNAPEIYGKDDTYNNFSSQVLKMKINTGSKVESEVNYLSQYCSPQDQIMARQSSELTKSYFDNLKMKEICLMF